MLCLRLATRSLLELPHQPASNCRGNGCRLEGQLCFTCRLCPLIMKTCKCNHSTGDERQAMISVTMLVSHGGDGGRESTEALQ